MRGPFSQRHPLIEPPRPFLSRTALTTVELAFNERPGLGIFEISGDGKSGLLAILEERRYPAYH